MRITRAAMTVSIVAMLCELGSHTVSAQTGERRAFRAEIAPKVEEVLVTGEHPGPGMWKVTHGENSLWILGTYAPLPQRLVWRSQEVEFAISEAQQVLGSYSASFVTRNGNPLAMQGKPLRRLLSRKDYALWRQLKQKYIGDVDEIETALPVTAALVLRSNALAQAGLANADNVLREIERLAKSYQVPLTSDHQVTKLISDVPTDDKAQRKGVDFLVRTMQNLQTDLANAKLRANAWATGDIESLRSQAMLDTTTAQLYASSWPYLGDDELAALSAETDARWLAAAQRALERNRTTVATLPIFMLLRRDGLLQALRTRGFEVIGPVG